MADYAISNVPRRVVYAASGTGPYAFTFEILNQTDIAVYKASTLLTLTTDYTVTINANGTGSVTLVLTAGTSNITIVGAKNIQRTTDFTTGGDLFANTLNDELDNQTIFIQQVAETAERGLKAPVVDPTDINMTLPAKASRVGTVLAFNATTGNPEAGPSIGSVTTVAAQSANINTVATNIASVNTVAGNITNVNTVAGISSNVTTVAGSISNVNTVADDLNEPTSEINTVAVDIANVNNVGNNISNVNTVAGVSAGVTTVAGISSNVTTVAGVAAGVTTVAGISSNVTTVAGISANVTTVAGISSNVTTVATNNTNVTTVAGSIANVNIVGNNIANVNQVAADTTVINSASANAATATTKAAEALASANSASASAAAASAVALGNEPVRHSVRPSLLLDFANTKTLDPRITYTRASTGTYYDGKTVAKAEENLLTWSQDYTQSIWTKSNMTITAGSTAAPDGTTTGQTATPTVTSGQHYVYNSASGANAITFSIYVKANGYNLFAFREATTGSYVVFNSSTVAVVTSANVSGVTVSNTAITSVGSSWYRITGTFTGSYSSLSISTYVLSTYTSGDPASATYAGDGTSGAYLWGAQLEQRSSVTAYQVTTTQPITNYIPVLLTAAAGVARFEHNPTTGESLGLEIEEQRTNLATYSELFNNIAFWNYTNVSIVTTANISPSGTQTAQKIVETATNASQRLGNFSLTVTNGAAYTLSIYAKAAERNWIRLGGDNFNGSVWFNLSSGTVGTVNASTTVTGYSINSVGNGWYRCIVSFVIPTTLPYFTYTIGNADNVGTYTGNGYSGIYLWGAQMEAGAFSTSYVPTVASQVTRSADSASMTGANFSSWYRTDEGSFYLGFSTADSGGAEFLSGQGTAAALLYSSSSLDMKTFNGTSGISTANTYALNTSAKAALSYNTTARSLVLNAGTVVTSTSGIQTLTQLTIGQSFGSFMNGNISKIAYYPKRLQNSELIALTTI
jgi:hypothetical protein